MFTMFSSPCAVVVKKNTAQCWTLQARVVSQVYVTTPYRLIPSTMLTTPTPDLLDPDERGGARSHFGLNSRSVPHDSPSPTFMTYSDLARFIEHDLRMANVYQPVLLMLMLEAADGVITESEAAAGCAAIGPGAGAAHKGPATGLAKCGQAQPA